MGCTQSKIEEEAVIRCDDRKNPPFSISSASFHHPPPPPNYQWLPPPPSLTFSPNLLRRSVCMPELPIPKSNRRSGPAETIREEEDEEPHLLPQPSQSHWDYFFDIRTPYITEPETPTKEPVLPPEFKSRFNPSETMQVQEVDDEEEVDDEAEFVSAASSPRTPPSPPETFVVDKEAEPPLLQQSHWDYFFYIRSPYINEPGTPTEEPVLPPPPETPENVVVEPPRPPQVVVGKVAEPPPLPPQSGLDCSFDNIPVPSLTDPEIPPHEPVLPPPAETPETDMVEPPWPIQGVLGVDKVEGPLPPPSEFSSWNYFFDDIPGPTLIEAQIPPEEPVLPPPSLKVEVEPPGPPLVVVEKVEEEPSNEKRQSDHNVHHQHTTPSSVVLLAAEGSTQKVSKTVLKANQLHYYYSDNQDCAF